MSNPVETWKSQQHSFEVWPAVERYATAGTPMQAIDAADLERMKWYGFFYRKRDTPGRYMNRIRITASELTARQAKEIAFIAYEYGHGIVDVTTRANLQVQGLDIVHLPKVAERLAGVGLTSKQTGHDNIRNVFAHPFSGLLPDELIDTRRLCHEITAIFLDSREYSDLPRKFNICLNGTAEHSAHFWTQDLSFLATRGEDGGVWFHVLLGGTQGQNPRLAWHLPVLVRPDEVVPLTRAILDLFRQRGSREKRNAARFRYLVEQIGLDGVRQWLAEHLPFPLTTAPEPPRPTTSHDELIGWFRQRQADLWTMGLSVPLGRLTWQQLEGLAVLAARWGDGQLRTTHEQGIAVINLPSAVRDAAATDAAALGLSVHADPLERNTMACTGSQFCNIAVTETKGQMFQLIERLRKKAIKLHGIRIHMSGCPSSCAQHFTADIGLKGVRVRRLLRTREGFDVFLGGGVAGEVQMALPYKLGVDADQLPALIEDVVGEYYLRRQPGQTFSVYWREKLAAQQPAKVADHDYRPPVWVCENCGHRHVGDDPPVFCPSCAGLRRYFARLEDGTDEAPKPPANEPAAGRADGFVYAAEYAALGTDAGLAVEIEGREYALFLADGKVHAVDAACPHEGAPLVQGEFKDGVISCPWHGWTFRACNGCSLDPPGHDLRQHETLIEDGKVYLRPASAASGPQQAGAANGSPTPRRPALNRPVEASLLVREVIQETPDVRTFRLDNSASQIPLDLPGRFVRVGVVVDGQDVWRSFTISSSPACPETFDLTIKLNPLGTVTRRLFEQLARGVPLRVKGPQGGYYFDPKRHTEPLALVSAGSGVTPMMSIARYLRDAGVKRCCAFVHGVRTEVDIIFGDECRQLATSLAEFQYHVTLSQPGDGWTGHSGRIDAKRLVQWIPDLASRRVFLCGPGEFMGRLVEALSELGIPPDRLHTEAFHSAAVATV